MSAPTPLRSSRLGAAIAAVAALAAMPVHAHVVLEYQVAPAASSYRATFKVGHGCEGTPTRQISIDIPAGVQGAKPMPKPGWALEITREKLAQPYVSHGRTITEDVSRATWTARTREDQLPNDQYDEFVLAVRTPEKPGTLYWPVRQLCERGRHDWVDVPAPGQKAGELKSPAAVLEVLPGGSGGHAH